MAGNSDFLINYRLNQILLETRMTTFIKTKQKSRNLENHKNIDKYIEGLQILQNIVLYQS